MQQRVKTTLNFILVSFTIALTTLAAYAQSSGGSFQISQSVIANGGQKSGAGALAVEGTAGQPAAGAQLNNSPYSHLSGFWAQTGPSTPTAAPASISGRVITSEGVPLAGVLIVLNGSGEARTVTDSNGNYHFESVETGSFYSVNPALANYRFNPASLSFSLMANKTDVLFTATADAVPTANPLDTTEFFVRQQYLDLLGREPDQGGLSYWSAQILACGNDASCNDVRRRDVAAAFFIEEEFQQSGSFIYDVYAGALGRRPVFVEYAMDRQQVIGGARLNLEKSAFAEGFVQRSEFLQKYQLYVTADAFVAALLQNVQNSWGIDLSGAREEILGRYNSGANQEQSRAAAVRALADNTTFKQSQYNAAFVLTEYFSYLRREPDRNGYVFWLNILNNYSSDYRGMVCSFITSTEYQRRFSSVVTHNNGECAR